MAVLYVPGAPDDAREMVALTDSRLTSANRTLLIRNRITGEDNMKRSTLVMGLLIGTASGLVVAQQRPPVTVPATVQAELKSMVGQWTLEDTVVTNGTSQKIDTGTMECKAAAGGMGVLCVEQDTGTTGPNHHRVDLFGYDADHNAERMSVLEDDGAL